MKPLIEYCSGAVKSLNAQYDMTRVLGHSATSGSARERLIQDFLVALLPEMTNIVSGIIIDSKGSRSKQQDIVLMLKSMPRLPFTSDHDLIFQEGAIAVFEIKTDIRPSTLNDIARNIESVRKLSPTSLGGTRIGSQKWPHARILSTVLTYGGSPLNSIQKKLSSLSALGQPDIYLDLTKGILIKNEGLLLDHTSHEPYLRFDSPAIGLARLLVSLSTVTGNLILRDINWEEYIS